MALDLRSPVLVVDDSQTMIKIICGLLGQIGFQEVDFALDGESALNKMQEKKYSFVISDWIMEPMTGLDFIRAIRTDPRLKVTPVIVVTAQTTIQSVVVAKDARVNAFIVKPFNAQKLKDKIAEALLH